MYMVSMLERNTQKRKRILSNGYIYCVPGLEDSYLLTSVLPKLIYTFYTFLIEPIEMKKE